MRRDQDTIILTMFITEFEVFVLYIGGNSQYPLVKGAVTVKLMRQSE